MRAERQSWPPLGGEDTDIALSRTERRKSEMYVANSAIRPQLRITAEATVPTRFGSFNMMVFNWDGSLSRGAPRSEGNGLSEYNGRSEDDGSSPRDSANLSPDHVALVMGDVRGR